MSLEIIASLQGASARDALLAEAHSRSDVAERPAPVEPVQVREFDMGRTMADLHKLLSRFNRRIEFTVDQNINRIIVKVIDRDTDKVIKEIPPEEIQHLLAGLRDLMGILVDEEI